MVINTAHGAVVGAARVGGIVVLRPFGTATANATSANTTQLTSTVQQGVVGQRITANSSLSPVSEVSSSFTLSGTIASVDVVVGSSVTAGQSLGTIDPTGLRLGQTAAVSIITTTSGAATLFVPTAAISTANAVSTVKVISAGTAKSVPVAIRIAGDAGTQGLTGLKRDQTVVIGTASNMPSTTGTTDTRQNGFGGCGGGFGAGQGPGGIRPRTNN